MAALLEYPLTLTVLLECIGILCHFSKPEWFLEICETPKNRPGLLVLPSLLKRHHIAFKRVSSMHPYHTARAEARLMLM